MPFLLQGDSAHLLSLGAGGIYYVLLLVFVIHVLILAYHWFSYGTSKTTSLTALATYLLGGAVLFLMIAGALRTF
ncbi:hypothetical protein KC727_01885 [Candidatus Kaiserbacteria bacterium]|nr:hypothetical protein [Candidatus Kaiserbacteria bacterium]